MFVELGSTADVWRAHMVRGILASYDIGAVVWHEHASALYSQGWGARCVLLVWEDDVDDAVEILKAIPDAVPESEDEVSPVSGASTDVFPGLGSLVVTGIFLWLALSLFTLALHLMTHVADSRTQDSEPLSGNLLIVALLGIPTFGIPWGLLTYLMLLALRLVPEFVKTVVAIIVIACLAMVGP